MRVIQALLAMCVCAPMVVPAAPSLRNAAVAVLEPVVQASGDLSEIDGLAFDGQGNLFGVLEIDGAEGGVVYIDKNTGAVTKLVSGINRADQIALHPSGDFFVTSETRPPAAANERVYRVSVSYDESGVPVSATAVDLDTTEPIDDPEGLVVLSTAGAYGASGDLIVGEDLVNGRILGLTPAGLVSVLVDTTAQLDRPEGLAFGDFGGALAPALYVAETADDNVLQVAPDGAVSVLGDPVAVGLKSPDNLEFGPDGYLYATEDRSAGRIARIGPDGAHSILADGFANPQGLAFDPQNGDLYVAAQSERSIYRIRFASAPPVVSPAAFTLYDATQGNLPSQQPWFNFASDAFVTGGSASHAVVAGGVRLQSDTVASSGYFNYVINPFAPLSSQLKNPSFPVLERGSGISLRFQLQVLAENHGSANRAGFDVILLARDRMGIEVAFWENEIWVQSGPGFTHGEGVAYSTTAALTNYELILSGDRYRLLANGEELLSGVLRDYSGFGMPYVLPSFLFLGDDTGSAGIDAILGQVELQVAMLDQDGDSVFDQYDNCIAVSNPDQSDVDQDSIGDACDDIDNSDFCFPIVSQDGSVVNLCL